MVGCEANQGNAFTYMNNSTEDKGTSRGSKQWPTLSFYSMFCLILCEVLQVRCELLTQLINKMCGSEL